MLCWKEASADDALDEHEWSPFDRVVLRQRVSQQEHVTLFHLKTMIPL